MNNREYEAACVAAAIDYTRFEGEHRLQQIDEDIAQVEKNLALLNEMRREIVNFYNLNKCEHNWHRVHGAEQCILCDEKRAIKKVYRHG